MRNERTKLRHQDIIFCLKFGKGRGNLADYLSKNATQWKSVSKSEREESNNLGKLLYTLHVTPVLDALEIREIAEHFQTDTTLTNLKDLIVNSKTYIPENLQNYRLLETFFPKLPCFTMDPFLNKTK